MEDDFFRLGGDSILSIRLASRLAEEFGTDVSPREVFAHPTPAELAALLDGHRARPGRVPGVVPVQRGATARCRTRSSACGSWRSSHPRRRVRHRPGAAPARTPRRPRPWRGPVRPGGNGTSRCAPPSTRWTATACRSCTRRARWRCRLRT
ncbi:acyl carrier protein [Streptomyces alboflavus]|uniref:acyl carrier protein n=1 Tax=Streptomyces alboflavus TaxID=67267 RepID=UPI001F1D97A3|nr:phosphopantetheine-binding protein [Streptomyces alboflavus]